MVCRCRPRFLGQQRSKTHHKIQNGIWKRSLGLATELVMSKLGGVRHHLLGRWFSLHSLAGLERSETDLCRLRMLRESIADSTRTLLWQR